MDDNDDDDWLPNPFVPGPARKPAQQPPQQSVRQPARQPARPRTNRVPAPEPEKRALATTVVANDGKDDDDWLPNPFVPGPIGHTVSQLQGVEAPPAARRAPAPQQHSPAAAMPGKAPEVEQRIYPESGEIITLNMLYEAFAGEYAPEDIYDFWLTECVPVGSSMALDPAGVPKAAAQAEARRQSAEGAPHTKAEEPLLEAQHDEVERQAQQELQEEDEQQQLESQQEFYELAAGQPARLKADEQLPPGGFGGVEDFAPDVSWRPERQVNKTEAMRARFQERIRGKRERRHANPLDMPGRRRVLAIGMPSQGMPSSGLQASGTGTSGTSSAAADQGPTARARDLGRAAAWYAGEGALVVRSTADSGIRDAARGAAYSSGFAPGASVGSGLARPEMSWQARAVVPASAEVPGTAQAAAPAARPRRQRAFAAALAAAGAGVGTAGTSTGTAAAGPAVGSPTPEIEQETLGASNDSDSDAVVEEVIFEPVSEERRLEAVSRLKNGAVELEDLEEDLRADRQIVLAAVGIDGFALQHASVALRADREVVLSAVYDNGLALQHARKKVRGDREVVMAAILENGAALEFAAYKIRSDHDIVLTAMTADPEMVRFASAALLDDRDFVLSGTRASCKTLLYASQRLRKDHDLVLSAVETQADALMHAAPELQADATFVYRAVSVNGCAIAHAAPELRRNGRILAAAIQNDPLAAAAAEVR